MLEIIFLGTKGYIEEENQEHKFYTGILFQCSDFRILLDYGENLVGAYPLDRIKPNLILLSHLHPDHAGGLKEKPSVEVYSNYESASLSKEILGFKINGLEPYKFKIFGPFLICLIPVYHSVKFPACGYIIVCDGIKVVVATDAFGFPGDSKRMIPGTDFYIGDGSFSVKDFIRRDEDKVWGHWSIKTQFKFLSKNQVNFFIITHLGSELVELEPKLCEEKIQEISLGIPFIIARDGKKYTLEKSLRFHNSNILYEPLKERRDYGWMGGN
jgi:phosphoribosyl 1,2-cyclic phosphodiesterase